MIPCEVADMAKAMEAEGISELRALELAWVFYNKFQED